MSELLLMHGTCACKAQQIRETGFHADSYFTDDSDIALYYGEVAADECLSGCDGYLVLDVVIPTDNLKVDYNSYDEPLTYFRDRFAACDRQWHAMLVSGDIPYPADARDHKTSLAVVNAVQCDAALPFTALRV
jgi:hypothetical protein